MSVSLEKGRLFRWDIHRGKGMNNSNATRNHAIVLAGTKIYVIGEVTPKLSRHWKGAPYLFVLDYLTDTWSKTAKTLAALERGHIYAFLWNDFLYVCDSWNQRIDKYDIVLDEFIPDSCNVRELRRAGATADFEPDSQQLIFFGGEDVRTLQSGISGEISVWNVATGKWNVPKVSGTPPSPRRRHSSCLVAQMLYIFGGMIEGSQWSNELYMCTHTFRWSNLSSQRHAPIARCGSTLTRCGSRLILFGGEAQQNLLDQLSFYEMDSQKWYSSSGYRLEATYMVYPGALFAQMYETSGHCAIYITSMGLLVIGGPGQRLKDYICLRPAEKHDDNLVHMDKIE